MSTTIYAFVEKKKKRSTYNSPGQDWVSIYYFSNFSLKIYVAGSHLKCLTELLLISKVLLMSTQNICFKEN